MNIIVIDQGQELFWFISQCLVQEELNLKHVKELSYSERVILEDLPGLVVVNGDQAELNTAAFINKLRNHVFARNTIFLVFTANTALEFKRQLLMAGAAQILYKGQDYSPDILFVRDLIKWFLSKDQPGPYQITFKSISFQGEAELSTYGRLGRLEENSCIIETNLNLKIGDKVDFKNSLFEELGLEKAQIECIDKNKTGHYYQYAQTFECKIHYKNKDKDQLKIKEWIKKNKALTKHKPIKIVFFEKEVRKRFEIMNMIKSEKSYCARGYHSVENLSFKLNFEIPHLILLNRHFLHQGSFEVKHLLDFLKNNHCYVITYGEESLKEYDFAKKTYPFAVHSKIAIDLKTLETMVHKLNERKISQKKEENKSNEDFIIFDKHSPFSRISFHSPCSLNELSHLGVTIEIPYELSHFSGCEVGSHLFALAGLQRTLFFRSLPGGSSTKTKLIFVGQNRKDSLKIKEIIEEIKTVGQEQWYKKINS